MISLAKSLQYKNALVKELLRVKNFIRENNSLEISKRNSLKISVDSQMNRYKELKQALYDLKVEIARVNSGEQQNRIIKLGELKDELNFYSEINTQHGQILEDSYTSTEKYRTYDALIQQDTKELKIKELQKEIDKTQEEIEIFNHNTKINVEIIL